MRPFHNRIRGAVIGLSLLAVAAAPRAFESAVDGGRGADSVRPAASTGDAHDDPVNQVLAISVDGLRSDAMTRLGDRAPHLNRLLAEGARTTNARTAYELTRTLPNHTSMVTGRRIATGWGGHGVTFNSDDGSTVHAAAGEYVASVFDRVHDWGGRTALYASKPKFRFFNRSWNARNGAVDRTGVDHGRDKIDRYFMRGHLVDLTDAVVADLASGAPLFTLLHYAAPDTAGHKYGWMSTAYLNAVVRTDRQIGRILATIDGQPRLRDHLAVILASDHGGRGSGHSETTEPRTYRVPFVVWGPGVAPGVNLYLLNPDYVNPGGGRPPYGGPQPVRNGMVVNLALDLLGLPRVPGSTLNAKHDLDVSR